MFFGVSLYADSLWVCAKCWHGAWLSEILHTQIPVKYDLDVWQSASWHVTQFPIHIFKHPLFFISYCNSKAVQEMLLTTGMEAWEAKVTVLAVMCQHTAGLKYWLALSQSHPAVARYSSNFFFFWSKSVSFFVWSRKPSVEGREDGREDGQRPGWGQKWIGPLS